ncbi:hypothetical protein NDU88_002873 [Pleurodeles waltl]|uniref:Uncharacterized protein n=1 Tax=Pleurodeles waltl TaxID=8319 RepID=A0AAV7LLD4_PLEWA|nr:hypothetical protein NDU88_002873 [Pleurodeles waltl]
MAARIEDRQELIHILSDSDEEFNSGVIGRVLEVGWAEASHTFSQGAKVQFVPRLVSPMLHKVQHWDVENRTLFQTGQMVEFVKKGEVAMKGILIGEAGIIGSAGRAQVRLDFWRPGSSVSLAGCGNSHALGEHEEHITGAELGRPALNQGKAVGVGTPLRHQSEERVRPGAARLTSGDATLSAQPSMQSVAYEEPSTS